MHFPKRNAQDSLSLPFNGSVHLTRIYGAEYNATIVSSFPCTPGELMAVSSPRNSRLHFHSAFLRTPLHSYIRVWQRAVKRNPQVTDFAWDATKASLPQTPDRSPVPAEFSWENGKGPHVSYGPKPYAPPHVCKCGEGRRQGCTTEIHVHSPGNQLADSEEAARILGRGV